MFRGVDNAAWRLETSLNRLPGFGALNCNTIEGALIRGFRKYAQEGTFDGKSEWYVISVAQH
ncbi:FRG domain-containing protein, partial [Acinetobacter baumannii]